MPQGYSQPPVGGYVPYVGTNPKDTGDYFDKATERMTERWSEKAMPIRVYIAPGSGVSGYRGSYRQIFINCFDEWMRALNQRLSWKLVQQEDDADIVCSWTDTTRDFQLGLTGEQGETKAMTMPDPDHSGQMKIVSATIKICTIMRGAGPLSDASAHSDILHEVGHALGILGHSPNFSDVMAAVYVGNIPNLTKALTLRDIATINRLYADYPSSKTAPQ